MSDLQFFDLMSFDENGNVCGNQQTALAQARSNFLYLVCKYNQNFLKEEKLPLPAFFKEQLGSVLEEVEKGGSYEAAKAQVFSNCLPTVQTYAHCAEAEAVKGLNKQVSLADLAFSQKVKNTVNNVHLGYVIYQNYVKIFDKIVALQMQDQTPANKSSLFKKVIQFNSLSSVADKVSKNDISKDKLLEAMA